MRALTLLLLLCLFLPTGYSQTDRTDYKELVRTQRKELSELSNNEELTMEEKRVQFRAIMQSIIDIFESGKVDPHDYFKNDFKCPETGLALYYRTLGQYEKASSLLESCVGTTDHILHERYVLKSLAEIQQEVDQEKQSFLDDLLLKEILDIPTCPPPSNYMRDEEELAEDRVHIAKLMAAGKEKFALDLIILDQAYISTLEEEYWPRKEFVNITSKQYSCQEIKAAFANAEPRSVDRDYRRPWEYQVELFGYTFNTVAYGTYEPEASKMEEEEIPAALKAFLPETKLYEMLLEQCTDR